MNITRKNIFIACIGIFLFSSMLYWQTAFFDFVWDDNQVIVKNQKIRQISLALTTFYKKAEQVTAKTDSLDNKTEFDNASAPLLKSEKKFDSSKLTASNWRPVRTTIHSIIFKCFKLEPFWYHLANIIGHGLVCIILFILLLQLTKNMLAALVGTLLFAVHPVNSEVVCWAKSLEDLLAAALLLATFNLILTMQDRKNAKQKTIITLVAVILFALALSAKLSVVFFPVFLIMFFIYRNILLHGLSIRKIINIGHWPLTISILLMLEATAAFITRSIVLGHTAQSVYITGNCWTTWLSMPRVFLRYLRLQILPYPLLSDYHSYPSAKNLSDSTAWLYTIVFLIVFISLTWILYKKKLFAPWLWFWCALIPFANIIAMNQLGAERFLYIPTIALAWLSAELFRRYTNAEPEQQEKRTRQAIVTTAAIIIIFAAITSVRSKVWSSELNLYRTTTRQFPDSFRPRYNLIIAYLNINQPEKALPLAKELLNKYPTIKSLTLYGQALCMTGNYAKGINILYKQRNNVLLNRVGIYAAKRGKLNEAERCFMLAIDIAPNNSRYKKNLKLLQKQREYLKNKHK